MHINSLIKMIENLRYIFEKQRRLMKIRWIFYFVSFLLFFIFIFVTFGGFDTALGVLYVILLVLGLIGMCYVIIKRKRESDAETSQIKQHEWGLNRLTKYNVFNLCCFPMSMVKQLSVAKV